MLGFTIALEDVDLKYINMAFKERLQNFSTMPTPADIRKSALEFADIDFRAEQRKTTPQIEYIGPRVKTERKWDIPWGGMYYPQVVEAGLLPAVKDWIINELKGEKGENYRKYLISFCNFPNDFMDR